MSGPEQVPEDLCSLVGGDAFNDLTQASDGDSGNWMTKIDVTNFAELTHTIKDEEDIKEEPDPIALDHGSYSCPSSSAALSTVHQQPLPSPADSLSHEGGNIDVVGGGGDPLCYQPSKTTPLIAANHHHYRRPLYLQPQYPLTQGYNKPIYSYSCLIALALKNSKTGKLTVAEIYNFMCENFPYFRTAPAGWKNSVRHNLSLNKCFEKIEIEAPGGHGRKSCLWCLNPNKVNKMDSEIRKWREKDPQGVRESLLNADDLEAIERGTKGLPAEQAALVYNEQQQRPQLLVVRNQCGASYAGKYAYGNAGQQPPRSWPGAQQQQQQQQGSAPKIPRLLCRSRAQSQHVQPVMACSVTPTKNEPMSPSAYSTPIQQLAVNCPQQTSPFNQTPPYSPNLSVAGACSMLNTDIQWCEPQQHNSLYHSPHKATALTAHHQQSPYALHKLIAPDATSPSEGLFTGCYPPQQPEHTTMSPCRLLNSSFGSSTGCAYEPASQAYEVTQAALNDNSLLQSALMPSPCKPMQPQRHTVTLHTL